MTKIELIVLMSSATLLCLAKCGLDEGIEGWKFATLLISGFILPALFFGIRAYRKGWKW